MVSFIAFASKQFGETLFQLDLAIRDTGDDAARLVVVTDVSALRTMPPHVCI